MILNFSVFTTVRFVKLRLILEKYFYENHIPYIKKKDKQKHKDQN